MDLVNNAFVVFVAVCAITFLPIAVIAALDTDS